MNVLVIIMLGACIENYILISIPEIIYPLKRKRDKWIAFVVLMILSFVSNVETNPLTLFLFCFITYIYSVVSLQKGNYIKKIFYSLISLSIVVAVPMFITGILDAYIRLGVNVSNIVDMFIYGTILSKLVLILVYYVLKKNLIKYTFTKSQWIIMMIMTCMLILFYMLMISSVYNDAGTNFNVILMLFLFLSMYILFIYYLIVISKNNSQLEQKDIQIKMLAMNHKLSKQILISYEANRKLKHDFSYHLTYLLSKVKANDMKSASSYIETMIKSTDSIAIIHTKRALLNDLINYRMNEITNGNIVFEHQISETLEFIKDEDLAVLLGNLLSNAVEAQAFVNQDKKIIMYIIKQNNMKILEVKNTYDKNKLKEDHHIFKTTKEDERFHGFGLHSIRNIVEKYNGDMEISHQDGYFVVCVFFNEL